MVDGLNYIEKQYMYQLMSTVQLPGSRTFDSQILIHSCTPKHDVNLAKYFQKHMSIDDHKNGVIDQGKYREIYSKRKWTDRQYHVQGKADVPHKYVNFL